MLYTEADLSMLSMFLRTGTTQKASPPQAIECRTAFSGCRFSLWRVVAF